MPVRYDQDTLAGTYEPGPDGRRPMRTVSGAEAIILPVAASHWHGTHRCDAPVW